MPPIYIYMGKWLGIAFLLFVLFGCSDKIITVNSQSPELKDTCDKLDDYRLCHESEFDHLRDAGVFKNLSTKEKSALFESISVKCKNKYNNDPLQVSSKSEVYSLNRLQQYMMEECHIRFQLFSDVDMSKQYEKRITCFVYNVKEEIGCAI